MNKQYVFLPIVVMVTTLVACTPPEKDIPGLTAGIDAAVAGHYGQSIYHEELAQDNEDKANNVLKHWKKINIGILMSEKGNGCSTGSK